MLPPIAMEDSAIGSSVVRQEVRSSDPPSEPSWAGKKTGMLGVAVIAAANFVLHMIFNNRYGYFRDEFD